MTIIDTEARAEIERLRAEAELCARHTPERDHNGVLCRACANAEVARLSQVIDEKIDSVGELVILEDRLRTALKKAQRGRSFAPDDERNEVVLIFAAADFEPVRAFIEG